MAAMEGLFHTEKGAGMVLIGQPNPETGQIDNPIRIGNMLSFLIYGTNFVQRRLSGSTRFRATSGPTRSHCCITRTTSWRDWEPGSCC